MRRREGCRRLTESVQPVRDLLERDSHKAVPSARTVRVLSHRRTPTVAISPINPHIYLRVFSFLTSRPPRTRTRYPLLVQAGVNRRPPSLPNTESSLISSQRYVKRNSLAALIKHITRSQITSLEGVPIIRSPCRIPAPPLHHFLDLRFEDLQMANNRRRTRKKRTKPSRRMSFLCNVLQIDCRLT